MKVSRLLVTKPPVEVSRAAVTAGHPLGVAVGVEILRRGGNAMDAAVGGAAAPHRGRGGVRGRPGRRADPGSAPPDGTRVVVQTEAYSTFYFARPQVIQVTGDGLIAGVDQLRPATGMGF